MNFYFSMWLVMWQKKSMHALGHESSSTDCDCNIYHQGPSLYQLKNRGLIKFYLTLLLRQGSWQKNCCPVIHTYLHLLFLQTLQHNSIYSCLALVHSTHQQNKLWTNRSWTTLNYALLHLRQLYSPFLVNISLVGHTSPCSSYIFQTCTWSSPGHM